MGSDLRDDIDGRPLEELHNRGDALVSTFKYVKPASEVKTKGYVRIVSGELLKGAVQVLKKNGGENNLHYHTNVETIWWVLKGKAKFYGPADVLIGELGANEGIVTPRYSRYWFENGGDEDLELIQIAASDMTGHKSGRTDLAAKPATWGQNKLFDEKSKEVTRAAE